MLFVVFAIAIGARAGLASLPPSATGPILAGVVLLLLGFVAWHLRDRFGTIAELFSTFARDGRWYLMPTLVVLVAVGALLVVAASSPLVAPFVYTLF
ncbi:MAG: DUF5989 family protein [Planctomycetota bacterium]